MPVLSVTMTVALPSVSTAGRWRTSACRPAIRWAAMASARVTVGSRPSGTLATMMPMAKVKLIQNGRSINQPMAKKAMPSATASRATRRDTRSISRCSGEAVSPVLCVRRAIRPNSVRMPVAKTTAVHSPATISVPANSRLPARSRSSPGTGAADIALASDSPVNVARLARSPQLSMTRQSAGTFAPSARRITSPGTRSATDTRLSPASRRTSTCSGSRRCKASKARSVRKACQNEKQPLTTMTPTMATPSSNIPWPGSRQAAKKASKAATQRRMAKKWPNSRSSIHHPGWRATPSTRLGPNSASRRAASPADRPPAPEPKWRRTISGVWLAMLEPARSMTGGNPLFRFQCGTRDSNPKGSP